AARLEHVEARVAVARAVVGAVAGPAIRGAGAARGARGEDVERAGARGAGARLGDVALALRRLPADEAARLEHVEARVAVAGAVVGAVAGPAIRGAGAARGA